MSIVRLLREFISIDCADVRSRIENEHGVGPWSEPRFTYFVEWHDETEHVEVVWEGHTHAQAVVAATDWADYMPAPKLMIVDKTGGVQ